MFCKAFVVVARVSSKIMGRAKENLGGLAAVTCEGTTNIIISLKIYIWIGKNFNLKKY